MKYFNLFLLSFIVLAILCANTSFAWDPHNDNPLIQATSQAKGNIKGLWFTAKENVDLTYKLYGTDPKYKFGYSIVTPDLKELRSDYLNKGKGIIERITSGEMINFWYEDIQTNTKYNSIQNLNKDNGWYFAGRDKNKGTRVFKFETAKYHDAGKIEFEAAPTGQPLPGVFVSLMLVSAAGIGFKKFVNKKQNQ